jgi:hypothetical protein
MGRHDHFCDWPWRSIAAACILAYLTMASAEEPPILEEPKFSLFYLDYFVVQRMLKGDVGFWRELSEASQHNPRGLLASFWWYRAARHCREQAREAMEASLRLTPPPRDEDLKNITIKATNSCRYSYYGDHRDEINQMIQTQHKAIDQRGSR